MASDLSARPKVFVSHSRRDAELVEAIGRALREADVTPIFYSNFFESGYADMAVSAAEDIANLINESCAVFILLGKNVSKLSHTQGWIGYEVGIASTKSRLEKRENIYRTGSVFLVEDISQRYEAAIPYIDYAYLFNFSDESHWRGVEIFARLKSFFYRSNEVRRATPISMPDEHEFRFRSFSCHFHCPWETCRSKYELWIYKGHYEAQLEPPPTIKCSVCRKSVAIVQPERGAITFNKFV